MSRILTHLRHFKNDPLLIIGTLWPVVILAPHLPIFQRTVINGLPWRQELVLTVLLTLTLVFLRLRKSNRIFRLDKSTLLPWSLAALFVGWIWLSIIWAADRYQALHLALQWTSFIAFFALILASGPRVIRASFLGLGGAIWILAVAALIEASFGPLAYNHDLRVAAKPILMASGSLGETMGTACVLFSAAALYLRRRRHFLFCAATASAAWLGTLFSLERASLIGATAGLVLLSLGVFVKPQRRVFVRLGLVSSVFAVVFLVQALPGYSRTDSTTSTVQRLNQSLTKDTSSQVRLLYWGIGLEMLRSHPLLGVGGNNYQVNYGTAHAQFASRYPQSPLIAMNDDRLTIYAHNEYVQMVAELGIVGLLLFTLFSVALVLRAVVGLKRGRHLQILGASGALLAFTLSSGASASSFRYLSGGLLFFFAAAVICRSSYNLRSPDQKSDHIGLTGVNAHRLVFALSLLMAFSVVVFSVQASGSILQARAENSGDPVQAERYYRASLGMYPANSAGQFSYGMWLYAKKRPAEGLPYLRTAIERGFNSSICFEYLAAAETNAGDLVAAERTLARAVDVYPASIFLRVRHTTALEAINRAGDAKAEFAKALERDPRVARGWQQLINSDVDTAALVAKQDKEIAGPTELTPETALYAVLQENELRYPNKGGWRARLLQR